MGSGANFLAGNWPILGNWGRFRLKFPGFSPYWTHFARRGEQLRQADDIVGGDGEDEDGADLVEAAHLQLRKSTHRLAPAEAFLDAFAQALANGVAEACC